MLDKLYITPRQWLHFLRWALYSLLLLFVAMLQTVVLAGRVSICPDFVPIVISCVCLREGPERGGTFALIASLLWCLSGFYLSSRKFPSTLKFTIASCRCKYFIFLFHIVADNCCYYFYCFHLLNTSNYLCRNIRLQVS